MLLGNPIFVLLMLVQFLYIPPPPPDGCQSSRERSRASSFDMVGRADIIVVAEAQTASILQPYQISMSEMPPVRLRTIRTIKGSVEPEFFIPAAFYAGGPGGDPEKTECSFWQTAVGDRHVLFLTRRADGSLRTFYAPSTDIAAPYRSDDHSWIELIQTYVAMQRDLSPS